MEKRGTGICQGLFNFILNTLSARGFNHEAMADPTLSCHSSDIPIEESSRNGLNPEVLVEYGHDVGWFNDPTRYNIWGGQRKTTPSVKVSTEKKNMSNLAAEAANPDTTKPLPPPAPPRPPRLLSVTSNINEKAEAFIHRRREKMSRNYSLDQKKF